CLRCHFGDDAEGDFYLDTREATLEGGYSGPAIVAGKPEESLLYTLSVLPADDPQIMPPDEPPLTKAQTDVLKAWIAAGAEWPDDARLEVRPRVDFEKQIRPILEQHCVACHQSDRAEGDYDLSTRADAWRGPHGDAAIRPFWPEESPLFALTALDADDDLLMPPASSGGPLKQEQIELLRLWIAQGAVWPDALKLTPQEVPAEDTGLPDDFELIRRIHAAIVQKTSDAPAERVGNYRETIPRTGAEFEMTPIPGGEFRMGSPKDETHRESNEGPQAIVAIAPFWMGKHEVTWDEYEPFMITQVDRQKNGARVDFDPTVHTDVDAVSQPTAPYMEMSFGMGQSGYPAISMTQHAANKYCQWLSAQTGRFYRLPTEAEWEYACRAGAEEAYSFGEDVGELDQYAWYYDNSDEKYQKVGQKKPNAWGLHDMHGNVSEWTADQFVDDYYERLGGRANNPFVRPVTLYPRTVRGGSWYDDPEQLRAAYRRGSDPVWKQQDPQLPKSIWYHTDARWLGFRVVRPVATPTVEEMDAHWNSATNRR
ncbi:MAG: SUMF1/EgtB/PvdO family nonheme iron enzyme, partial [Planctomycetota bacterium]